VLKWIDAAMGFRNEIHVYISWGTAEVQWLRYCATNHKVVGSVPDGVSGIFH
jgi:hypothetical protein